MDSDGDLDIGLVILHRILKQLVCDVGDGVFDLILASLESGQGAVGGQKCSHVVAQKIGGQSVIPPTGTQGGARGRECQRQVFTLAGSFSVVIEGLAHHHCVVFSSSS
jgi:hypothetical protein